MVENAHIFQNMLMQGEEIVKVFKPHKGRFWASRLLGHLPGLLIFMVFAAIFGGIMMFEAGLGGGLIALIFIGIFLGLPLIFFVGEIIAGIWWYKNRWYCYTNRRIIIQCGILIRNFRMMDLHWASNSFVRISILDRMLGKQTGTIKFSNMGSPMMNMGGGRGFSHGGMGGNPGFVGAMFYFLYVQHPHDILREIQEYANALQEQGNVNNQNLANQINNLAAQIGNMQGGNNNQGNNMGNNNQGFGGNNNQGFNGNNQGFGNNNNQGFGNNQGNNGNNNNNNGGWN